METPSLLGRTGFKLLSRETYLWTSDLTAIKWLTEVFIPSTQPEDPSKRKIQALQAEVDASRARKRKKAKMSLNSKFADIEAIWRA
ncbi:hypothetical protein K456DRAFT_58832 [Colletotrichum gloeosporioides 23]|nr:hypothetical protein K456DRAFT_58832 [Colletotrichum gloeosporioides 23]